MLLLAEDILAKQVPIADVFLLVIYSLPQVVALSFPFASLVGALMTVGRLSSDNEIIAFQASGIHLFRLFFPLFFFGLIFSYGSFLMNDYFLPLGTINFGKLYRKLIYSNPELELQANSVTQYQNRTIVSGDIEEGTVRDLLILDRDPENNRRIITADQAKLAESSEQSGVISIDLDDVFIQTVELNKKNQFNYAESESMIYNILLQDITFAIRNPGPREMGSLDVYKLLQELEKEYQKKVDIHKRAIRELQFKYTSEFSDSVLRFAKNPVLFSRISTRLDGLIKEIRVRKEKKIIDRRLQITKLEFYKKFAIPFACLVFVFFAFPIGLLTKKSGRTVGFGLGLLVSIIYWGLLVAGQSLGLQYHDFSPFFAMWMPNFVILCFALLFLILRIRK